MLRLRIYKFLHFLHILSKEEYKKKSAPYKYRMSAEYKAIAKSKLFDKWWYLEHNPDVAKAGKDPIEHYLKYGWKNEKRPTTPYFDEKKYAEMYPDVKEANVPPLLHWIQYGAPEGRQAPLLEYKRPSWWDRVKKSRQSDEVKVVSVSEYFDEEWYLKQYPSVKSTGLSATRHYTKYGWREGKNPSKDFNTKEYLEKYPECKICPLVFEHNRNEFTDLSICAIMKNEGPYVKEWIDYHRLVGVKRFYIYDNESTDNMKEVLTPYIEQGIVVYKYFPGQAQQLPAYNECINEYRDKTEWLALIDTDEFIVPVEKNNIPEFLEDYKEFPGVGINWICFDSNGHKTKPKGGVLENYTRVHYDDSDIIDHHIKSIIKPQKTHHMINAHSAEYLDNLYAVNEEKKYIVDLVNFPKAPYSFISKVSVKKICINHYYCKSVEEYENKISKGRPNTTNNTLKFFKDIAEFPTYKYNYSIYKYVRRLKPKIAMKEYLRYLWLGIVNIRINLYQKLAVNEKWYFHNYPEAKKTGLPAYKHYDTIGWKNGYNPNPYFDTIFYLTKYLDVKKASINPLQHYVLRGQFEGRYPTLRMWKSAHKNKKTKKTADYQLIAKSKYFDKKWYLKTYPDVARAGIDPVTHYLNTGWKEGRLPSLLFDSYKYLNRYIDVSEANINPLIHYEQNGKKENREVYSILTETLEKEYKKQLSTYISHMSATSSKIVLFSHELTNTGAPYALLKTAKILKNNGWDVLVVSCKQGKLESQFNELGIPYLIIPHLLDLNISFYAQTLKNIDFALCNTIILAELATKLQNILPTLLYIHEAEEGIRNQDTKEYYEERINYLRHISSVACVSPFAKSFYAPFVANINLIRNSVTAPSYFPQKKHKNIKFAYVGAIVDNRKNVSLLVTAFQRLNQRCSNIELHLIGKDNTVLGKKIKALDIKNIIFHGELIGKNKEKLFNEMDVFVIPSHLESCSLVALEAAARSKANILTENVGAKYMFKDHESALICKVDDEQSLYESMKEICDDKKLRNKLAKNAYNAYLKYGTEKVTDKDLSAVIKQTIKTFNQMKKINDLTIIVPIYNAAEKVDKCIQSIIKNTNLSEQTKLLLIDDCSPEDSVGKMLSKYKNRRFVTIVRNAKNLGYTFNINKAIKLAKNRDVILLNSDTIVTKNWIKKLQNVAYMSPSIGTVTPVSNSAGAFSVPESGTNVIPPFLNIEKMAQIVAECGKDKFFDVPTGNGFCFFIKAQVIKEVGLFDEKNFPRGYGEENDYSMRAKQKGFLNLVTLDTYIFHHEHASFKETSVQLMQKSAEIINRLYPQYKRETQVFNSNLIFNSVKENIENLLQKELIKKYKHENIKFSVIMPTYNRAFCICTAIDSLLAQTYQHFELIICDDGSADNTESLIRKKYAKELKTKKIIYLKSNHEGVCAARNTAMQKTSGDWIAYLDSDNYIVSDYLMTYVSYICSYPQYQIFYAKMRVDGTNYEIGESFDRQKLENNNFIDLGVLVHHRSLMNKYGLFDTTLKRLVDWDLILRYTKDISPYFINKAVLIYKNDQTIERISSNNYAQPHYIAIYKKYNIFSNITVTTMITTYNHEKYIRQAIESALKQTGNFKHEILISDDASTDKTPHIIKEYAEKYPDIIKNISSQKNLGISENMKKCFQKATGKYIAVLEGDDYWTDAKKLQKQLDFMEKNPNCSMVFSKIKIVNNKTHKTYFLDRQQNLSSLLSGNDVINEPTLNLIGNFSCCMFKAEYMKTLPDVIFTARVNEISLSFYLEQKGKIGFISTPLSVYRQHENGVWTGASRKSQLESGLKGRQVALAVCAKKYKPALQKIIDEQYIKPLRELGEII